MKTIRVLFIIFLIIVFISGIFVIFSQGNREEFENQNIDYSCPDLLIQKGNSLLLYNTKLPLVDGSNPLPFFNLDEYINYLETQGGNCPVLYLQQETNTQGKDVYRVRPSPFELQGGLPSIVELPKTPIPIADASRENTIYNSGQYPGYDPQGQYVGIYTNLDAVHDSTSSKRISDNPMDDNWAGTVYTQQMIDSGKYADNNVSRPKLYQPTNTTFFPTIMNNLGVGSQPMDIL
jgi:hypothetical protein